jgi:D-tyrosyl-tRNA(Tyr) deacylase
LRTKSGDEPVGSRYRCIIVVSQFTLHAVTKRQSSFLYKAAKPDVAIPLYENFVKPAGKIRKERYKQVFLG